jgi:hypothetical protein
MTTEQLAKVCLRLYAWGVVLIFGTIIAIALSR